jgi:hypothetical protein
VPLSPNENARARQLANLRRGGEVQRPEQPNLQHGAYARVSQARLQVKVTEMRDALAEDVPVVSHADTMAITELAVKLCQLDGLRVHLAERGFLDDAGEVRPAAHLERQLSAQVDDKLDALGCTPRSRAKLGLDMARGLDLAQTWANEDGTDG